jgi:hypothetical protein
MVLVIKVLNDISIGHFRALHISIGDSRALHISIGHSSALHDHENEKSTKSQQHRV